MSRSSRSKTRLRKKIEEAVTKTLEGFVGARNTQEDRAAIAEKLGDVLDPFLPKPTIEAMADGSYRVTMPVGAEELGRIAWSLYEVERMTHEEVTAWLCEHVPRFREVLEEVTFGLEMPEGGKLKRWMPVPKGIIIRCTLEGL
jgi:hypothetical protein